ncbi:MAG TPA: SMI1/KNR4 family protein [Verrucomicrobiae bacterium]|nr:SMI1/KNR4 family protein [Verrucomicrobiae bacterium]
MNCVSPQHSHGRAATPENIWKVPAYLPYVQPPLTDAAVAAAEAKIGHKLPADYLNLLRQQNGGYIRYSLPDRVHDTIAGIGPRFPSLENFDWSECQEFVGFPLTGLVPFDGDGHWHLCLDYRHCKDAPAVTYVDIECDHETPVAASFKDYLGELKLDLGGDYVVEGVSDIHNIVAALSAALRVRFEPPDTYAHGYPVHSAPLGTKKNPEWVWVSPNQVLRGFVRTDDARYNELKDLMPGEASRFPEVPPDACILNATDAVIAKVLDACARSKIAVRPLREYVCIN